MLGVLRTILLSSSSSIGHLQLLISGFTPSALFEDNWG